MSPRYSAALQRRLKGEPYQWPDDFADFILGDLAQANPGALVVPLGSAGLCTPRGRRGPQQRSISLYEGLVGAY